ncbi:ATP-binding protein [Acrocarpospora catenulata]|uniref:ATP-binding protein n=1 Tax=Acrocarpospora catenulata TaxID=2836182 RepID=UPI001BDAB6B4
MNDRNELGSVVLPGTRRAPAQAREHLAKWLSGLPACDADTRDTVVLLLSEIVTNAVVHSESGCEGGKVAVRAETVQGSIRVEVTDEGSATNAPHLAPIHCDVEGGRGLHLVAAMAEDWGARSGIRGQTTTWFSVLLAGAAEESRPAVLA